MTDEKVKWILAQHERVNHFYDNYIPYRFHLEMVAKIGRDFMHLLPQDLLTREEKAYHNSFQTVDETKYAVELACYGHDLLEDVHGISYNDTKSKLGQNAADIIYALTNEKGKNRKERANDKYYKGIRNTPGAVFVKLCDRIANVQYSKMSGSRMFEMYRKENEGFLTSLGFIQGKENELDPMVNYLIKLISEE